MRLGGCRTRVRRGLTWGAATNMAAHASGAASEFFFFFFTNSRRLGFDSCQFAK